jgi:hypothetical protein
VPGFVQLLEGALPGGRHRVEDLLRRGEALAAGDALARIA